MNSLKTFFPAGNVTIILLMFSFPASAQWKNITLESENPPTIIARTTNRDGYSLEIYRDSGNSIRSRLTMASELINIAERSCPTFQIDRGKPRNRSLNDAPCISNSRWAEFILGHVDNGVVESSTLRGMMLGNNITFRFILDNGDYRETTFSLSGSMVTMQKAFGQDITVTGSR